GIPSGSVAAGVSIPDDLVKVSLDYPGLGAPADARAVPLARRRLRDAAARGDLRPDGHHRRRRAFAVAMKLGWFKQEGLAVEVVPLPGSTRCRAWSRWPSSARTASRPGSSTAPRRPQGQDD